MLLDLDWRKSSRRLLDVCNWVSWVLLLLLLWDLVSWARGCEGFLLLQ